MLISYRGGAREKLVLVAWPRPSSPRATAAGGSSATASGTSPRTTRSSSSWATSAPSPPRSCGSIRRASPATCSIRSAATAATSSPHGPGDDRRRGVGRAFVPAPGGARDRPDREAQGLCAPGSGARHRPEDPNEGGSASGPTRATMASGSRSFGILGLTKVRLLTNNPEEDRRFRHPRLRPARRRADPDHRPRRGRPPQVPRRQAGEARAQAAGSLRADAIRSVGTAHLVLICRF